MGNSTFGVFARLQVLHFNLGFFAALRTFLLCWHFRLGWLVVHRSHCGIGPRSEQPVYLVLVCGSALAGAATALIRAATLVEPAAALASATTARAWSTLITKPTAAALGVFFRAQILNFYARFLFAAFSTFFVL